MADAATIVHALEVTLNTPMGKGTSSSGGGGGVVGKKKGGGEEPPSLGIRKAMGHFPSKGKAALGGAISSGAAKIPGVNKIDPKMMGMAKQSLKHAGATAKGAGKSMGISVGVASILKQSQLFTGVIGTIFQILGMLVDVIIMPFMPILIPVIKLLASMIPPMMVGAMFIQKGIQKLVDWVGQAGKVVMDTLRGWWNALPFWSGPFHPFKVMFEIIKGIINTSIEIIKGAWGIGKVIIQGIWDIIKMVFNVYKAIFKLYFDIIKAIINTIISIIKGAWSILKTVVESIWGFIQTAYSGAKSFIGEMIDGIKGFFTGLWNAIPTFIASIGAFLAGLGSFLLGIGKTVIDFILIPFKLFWELIKTVWGVYKAIFNAAIDFVKSIPGTITKFISSVWDLIKTWATGFVNAIIVVKDWAMGILEKVKEFFLGVWDTAKNWFSTAVTSVKDFFTTTWTTAKDWFSTAKQWLIDRIKDWASNFISAIITIKDFAVGIFQKIKDFFKDSWITAKNWVLDRVTGAQNFITGLWDKAKEIIDVIKNKVISVVSVIGTIKNKVVSLISTVNPANWIPILAGKLKALIPSPKKIIQAIPGAGTVGKLAGGAKKLKFWQEGGIITRPTLGIAGEGGPEAIIPLRHLTRTAINTASNVHITVINRTPEGRESQETFMITRHQEQEQEFEFEVQQRTSLLGVT